MPRLTKRLVDALEPDPGRDRFVWDSDVRGFGIRVKPSGVASYLVQYRTGAGATRRMVVGKVGTLTPDEARRLAREKLADVSKGQDPSANRHADRSAMTVAELCDAYLAEAEAGRILGRTGRKIKPNTLALDRGRIECHVKPLLGRRQVRNLTLGDLEGMQADIAAGRTATAKRIGRGASAAGGPGTAARTLGMFKTILQYAVRRRIIEANPADGARKLADRPRKRFLSVEEIGTLGAALHEADAEDENPVGLAAIRFILMTGLRRMEALSLRLDDVDHRAGCVHLRDSKSGEQVRPIGRAALAVLDMMPRREDSPWAFPGSGDGHFVGMPKVLDRVAMRAKLTDVSAHVLRHSFASVAEEVGMSQMTIAGLLGHSVPGVTARYTHLPDSVLVAAANTVAARIAGLLDPAPAGDVVTLRPPAIG